MAKIWLEICLISARGLRRTSSLWKLQWFSVGWIDPNNKYCTRVDSSGNVNPNWKTKFSTFVDTSDRKFKDLALHVEVYSREPIFLRERLEGTATVVLKEFLDKYVKNSEVSKPIEDVGSFQLRKGNSSKPQGFVDISIRVSEEKEEPSSYPGNDEGFKLSDHNNSINLSNNYGPAQTYPPKPPLSAHTAHFPPNYSNSSGNRPSYPPPGGYGYQPPQTPPLPPGPSYQTPQTPPPPPPPANVGYIPTFLPRTNNLQPSYVNMPPSAGGGAGQGRGGGGFGMGLGAGALAAGAIIFGDDFMSGFDFQGELQDPSLIISTDPPF